MPAPDLLLDPARMLALSSSLPPRSSPHSAGEYFRIDGETLEQRLSREGRLAPTAVVTLGIALIESGHGALPPERIFVARSGARELVRPLGTRPSPLSLACPRQVYALVALLWRCLGDADLDPGLAAILDKAGALELDAWELRDALVAWRTEAARVERLLADFLGVDPAPPQAPRAVVPLMASVPPPFRPQPAPSVPSMPSPPSLRLNLLGIKPVVVVDDDA